MGLAVSQIRLLALTTRKADIELQMQVNSKRKQMLTRKSTDLAQQYYNRLQDTNVQYATSAGYEDVNYDYAMGQTNSAGRYTEEFIAEVVSTASKQDAIPRKFENNMILTDQYGQVVVNNQMAEIVAKVNMSYPAARYTTQDKAAYGIAEFIKQNKNNGLSGLYQMISNATGGIDENNLRDFIRVVKGMIQNEGAMIGGKVFTTDLSTGKFYASAEGMKNNNPDDIVQLKEGYMYEVRGKGSTGVGQHPELSTANIYLGGTGVSAWCRNAEFSEEKLKYLANLVSYFAPILSAAITNGTTAKVDMFSDTCGYDICTSDSSPEGQNYGASFAGQYVVWQDSRGSVMGYFQVNSAGIVIPVKTESDPVGQKVECGLCSSTTRPSQSQLAAALPNLGNYLIWTDASGSQHYFQTTAINSDGSPYIEEVSGDKSAAKFYDKFTFKTASNDAYYTALNTQELQAGFKSGVYQFCMVDDVSKGIYHKNTTMKYFTHMSYVVEKADSSQREEITAWFNAENAAISEQETYWDTEIQNLSTELSAITTEIESVKKLKSDSIKNVFNWGGN